MIFRKHPRHVKTYLANPFLEHRIVFKRGAVEAVKKVKGWRSDAEMARALGLTRQYISMLHKTRVGVTSTVICRLAVALGSTMSQWWVFYEIIPYGVCDPNHPMWNQEKYIGCQPYASRFGEECRNAGKTYASEARD